MHRHRCPIGLPPAPRRGRARPGLVLAAALGLVFSLPAQAITGDTPTAGFASVGNGVQVTADWVFTAQHAGLNPGDTFTDGFGSRTVAARYDAPGSGVFPANDFALMRLVPALTLAPALPVLGVAWPDGSLDPMAVTIASAANAAPARGYGFTTITEVAQQFDPDGPDPLGPVTVNWLISLDDQVHVEGGDSGGALFWGHVSDSSLLLGITSALLTDEQDQPIGSAFVQPAAYRSWIDQVMLADAADVQQVLWVSAVPEPATWALWFGAGLLWLSRGRLARTALFQAGRSQRSGVGRSDSTAVSACKARNGVAAAIVAS